MLHTKFQGHQPFGSREDVIRFLPYMDIVAILVMWPGPFEQTFVSPSHKSYIWNMTLIGLVVSEKIFKECGRRTTTTDDGWRRPTYPINSSVSLRHSWSKNWWTKWNYILNVVSSDVQKKHHLINPIFIRNLALTFFLTGRQIEIICLNTDSGRFLCNYGYPPFGK